jgi:hypothetical protein
MAAPVDQSCMMVQQDDGWCHEGVASESVMYLLQSVFSSARPHGWLKEKKANKDERRKQVVRVVGLLICQQVARMETKCVSSGFDH